MTLQFSNDHVSFVVNIVDATQIHLQGEIANPERYEEMEIMAPHSIDRRTSYSGSGLPFPCPPMALENTPNRAFATSDGKFVATFSYPNSYYTFDAKTKVKPSIFFVLSQKGGRAPVYLRFELPEDPVLFLRTLTHRPGRTGPAFYSDKDTLLDPIPRSAEHVMRSFIELKATRDKAV